MPAPHPLALRRRVVDAYENGEGTYDEIAARFCVGVASVSRWLGLLRWSGDIAPRPTGGDRRSPLVSEEVRGAIEGLVRDEPNWTTAELAEQVEEDFGVSLSRRQIGNVLRGLGFSFKRGSSDHELRGLPPRLPRETPSSSSKGCWTRRGSSS